MLTPGRDDLVICIDLNLYDIFQAYTGEKQILDLFRKAPHNIL